MSQETSTPAILVLRKFRGLAENVDLPYILYLFCSS